jgi:hypothetical protein
VTQLRLWLLRWHEGDNTAPTAARWTTEWGVNGEAVQTERLPTNVRQGMTYTWATCRDQGTMWEASDDRWARHREEAVARWSRLG